MQITERQVGDIVILTVAGDITLGKGGDVAIKDRIHSLMQQGHRKLLLDLGDVSYVDSAGLGELVHAHVTATKAGGSLRLLRLTKRLKDLLTITKLVTVFDSYDDEAAGLASFSHVVA